MNCKNTTKYKKHTQTNNTQQQSTIDLLKEQCFGGWAAGSLSRTGGGGAAQQCFQHSDSLWQTLKTEVIS